MHLLSTDGLHHAILFEGILQCLHPILFRSGLIWYRKCGMGDRQVFTEFACSQLAARIAIGSCDPPISRSCARRRLDLLAAIFKGAERIQALNGKLDAYRVFHYSSNLRQMKGFRVYIGPGHQQIRALLL